MNEEENIIKELKDSGYPLEIEATLVLESKGWNVLNQEGYLDIEENKWRTIDILASKNMDLSSSSVYKRLHFSLAIECKKLEKPWVFWTREKKPLRIFDPISAFGLIKIESKPQLHPLHFENIANCFHYYSARFNKVALIPYEPFLKSGKSIIFEAKSQVIKFLLYEMKRTQDFFVAEEYKEKAKPQYKTINLIALYFPLIIIDGKLYEMEFEKDEPKLVSSNHIQYLTSFGFQNPDKNYSGDFLIDIIKIDFLKEYLDMVEEELKQFATKIASIQTPYIPPSYS
jgi:hypothetical protein